jgi:hypothetical protein
MGLRLRILDHIEISQIKSIVKTHPRMQHLTNVLVKQHGFSRDRARLFGEQFLVHALDNFGEKYLGEMSTRIDQIVSLRNQIDGVYESVLAGKGFPDGTTPNSIEGVFRNLQREMDNLKSPTQQAQAGDIPRLRDDEVSSLLSTHAENPSGVASIPNVVERGESPNLLYPYRQFFAELDSKTQQAISKASEQAPNLVRRVIIAEDSSTRTNTIQELANLMRQGGISESDSARMIQGLKDMNNSYRATQRAPGTPEGNLREKAIKNIVAQVNDSQFQSEVTRASTFFSRLAHENPAMVKQLWQEYQDSGSSRTFRQYVLARMKTHIRGMAGEYTSAFELGNGLSILKGPDYDVTIPGTDLVGVADLTGDIWLIDNKAWSSSELSAVDALTRNLVGNIADDAKDFASIASHSKAPSHIVEALKRLEKANRDIRSYTKGMTPEQVNSVEVQQEITRICNRYRIRRVVTNAGGEIQGLSEGLLRRGIELEDLNH